ncbi:MaoC family dehydratase [Chloroflexota bacterium]
MLLVEIKKSVTQENINLYAEASHDFNPIHIDEEFARNTPLGGTIAHGMLILAYVSQMMTATFGRSWLVGSKLNVRFKAPARPGDVIAVSGKISKLDKSEEHTLVDCEVLCSNQKGETVITGEAKVKVKSNELL